MQNNGIRAIDPNSNGCFASIEIQDLKAAFYFSRRKGISARGPARIRARDQRPLRDRKVNYTR